jgi:hypothetical protein
VYRYKQEIVIKNIFNPHGNIFCPIPYVGSTGHGLEKEGVERIKFLGIVTRQSFDVPEKLEDYQ